LLDVFVIELRWDSTVGKVVLPHEIVKGELEPTRVFHGFCPPHLEEIVDPRNMAAKDETAFDHPSVFWEAFSTVCGNLGFDGFSAGSKTIETDAGLGFLVGTISGKVLEGGDVVVVEVGVGKDSWVFSKGEVTVNPQRSTEIGEVTMEQHLTMIGIQTTIRLAWVNEANVPWRDGSDGAVSETDMGNRREETRPSQSIIVPEDCSDHGKIHGDSCCKNECK